MQLDVLLGLCGPEVQVITEATLGPVPEEWEQILVLDLDHSKRSVALAGPHGSLHRVLCEVEAVYGMDEGQNGEWREFRCCRGGVLRGVCFLP